MISCSSLRRTGTPSAVGNTPKLAKRSEGRLALAEHQRNERLAADKISVVTGEFQRQIAAVRSHQRSCRILQRSRRTTHRRDRWGRPLAYSCALSTAHVVLLALLVDERRSS